MIVKLLTEHHLEFLSLRGGCRGLSESTLVKMPHCLKSHATAQMVLMTLPMRTTHVLMSYNENVSDVLVEKSVILWA